MQNLLKELENVLQENQDYISDGKILKNKVVEHALKVDPDLIKLLLKNENIKKHFFVEIDKALIFDKIKFQEFVSNKEFLPNSYTAFKNRIGLSNGNGLISSKKDVVLTWAYKDCVLEGGMTKEDKGRKEIFYNETLSPDEISRLLDPKVLTNFEYWDSEAVKKNKPKQVNNFKTDENGNIKDNLLIKGNNLLALHCLKKRFAGKIKLIYIDPPFNTGSDSFKYNDKFSRSTWLTFMKNRLKIAKTLLDDDGSIFIHIDINHSHYLKVVADEVFEEKNFVEELIWAYGSPSGGRATTPKPVNIHDYIFHYARNYEKRKQNRVHIPYSDKYIKDWFKYADENGRIYQKRQRGKDENGKAVWERQYLDESKGIPLSTVWNDIKQVYADPRAYKTEQSKHTELIKSFTSGQKPEALLKRILEMSTDTGDIVLDFFAGSGTTPAVAHKMGRQWIAIEQMDYIKNLPEARMKKVIEGEQGGISKQVNWKGGGDFIYCELTEWNEKFVQDIRKAKNTSELLKIYEKTKSHYFMRYELEDFENFNLEKFKELSLQEQKKILITCLDKNHLYINYSEIDDTDYKVSQQDKKLSKEFYGE